MKQQQSPQDIINIVVKIFQNVGIKRWIDRIQVLQNQQIYFEICKVIIPQSMIKLLKLAQSNLSTPQKIQGVIDIVKATLKIDLYHISGQAIADGKLSHIRNFLHILEALSQTALNVVQKGEQVQSAPQNTKSHSDIDQQGPYTVIGMNKQFHNEFQQDENNINNEVYDQRNYHYENPGQMSTRRNKQSASKNVPQQEILKSQSQSQSHLSYLEGKNIDNPMKPEKNKNKTKQLKNKSQIKLVNKVDKMDAKHKKRPFVPKIKKQSITYQLPVKNKFQSQKQSKRKKSKSIFMKKMFSVVQQLQQKKIIDQEADFNKWIQQHQKIQKQNVLLINLQSRQRIEFTNAKIQHRQKIISTLKGQKKALNSLQNLFYQQKAIWKGLQKGKYQAEIQQLQSLIGNYFQDQTLLREALVSGSSEILSNKPPSNRRNIKIQV